MVFTESNRSSSSETDDISLILRHLLHRSSSSSSSSSSSLPSSSSPSMITPAAGKEIPLSFLSSSSSPPPPPSTGVTGVILPDNLRRLPSQPAVFSGSDRVVVDRISTAESSAGLNTSTGIRLTYSSCFPVTGGGGGGSAVSSSPVGPVESESTLTGSVQLRSFDNDTADEYDCESEEGPEAAVEEAQPEQPQRKPSKRSRAAEVHNLSEKRRRSRINEKMKALQNLIPNSNKTDKASMLDEAIEYLKQLQLQVQMLSMRNGVTLHPMCLPGVRGDLHSFQLNQAGMDFSDREGSMHTDLTSSLSLNQETQDPVFTLPNPYASPTGASIGNISSHNSLSVISPEFVFGLQSSLPAHLSPYHVPLSSEDICREDSSMSQQQLVGNHSETNSVETWELKELKPGTGARMRLPCDMRASYVNEDRSFEGCVYPERTDGLIEQSLSCDLQGKYHILSDKPTKGSGKT